MSIVTLVPAPVNPDARNPRDDWPDWTDEHRWVPTGPTHDFGFAPTIVDDLEAMAILNDGLLDLDPEFEAERMQAAFADPSDLLADGELVECRGHRAATPYDL